MDISEGGLSHRDHHRQRLHARAGGGPTHVITNVTEVHNVVATFAADACDVNASVFFSDRDRWTRPRAWPTTATTSIDLIPDTGYHPSYHGQQDPGHRGRQLRHPGHERTHNVIVFFAVDTYTICRLGRRQHSVSGAGGFYTYSSGRAVPPPRARSSSLQINWTEAGVEVSQWHLLFLHQITGPGPWWPFAIPGSTPSRRSTSRARPGEPRCS